MASPLPKRTSDPEGILRRGARLGEGLRPQETIEPLKNLKRFVGFGIAGGMFITLGIFFLALAGPALHADPPLRRTAHHRQLVVGALHGGVRLAVSSSRSCSRCASRRGSTVPESGDLTDARSLVTISKRSSARSRATSTNAPRRPRTPSCRSPSPADCCCCSSCTSSGKRVGKKKSTIVEIRRI